MKIRRILVRLFIFAAVGTVVSFFALSITSAQSNPITKDLSITLSSLAERFSDVEYWQFSPKDNLIEHRVFTNESDMTSDQTFDLGTKTDERSNCVELIGTRRTGICEDGFYKFEIKSTDAAGNPSETSEYSIERDTVNPEKADTS